MSFENNPYEPPHSSNRSGTSSSSNGPSRARLHLEPASRGMRLLAALLDGLITMITVLPIMYSLKLFDHPTALSTQLTAFLLGFVSVIVLHGYLLHIRGQSIGKAIVGIQIVSVDGQMLPLGHIVFRRYLPVQLASQIPTLGSLLALLDAIWIFREDKRCLHDHVAGTMVVIYSDEEF